MRGISYSNYQVAIAAIIAILLCCNTAAQDKTAAAPPSQSESQPSPRCGTASRPTENETRNKAKDERRGSFVAAPMPVSSPAVGTGIIPVVAYIFRLRKDDEVSPPSAIGAVGLITDNDTRVWAVGAQLFFKCDTYRLTTAYVRGNLNYNFYGPGLAAENQGLKLPLMQDGALFYGEFLRRLKWNLFIGPRVLTGHSVVTVRPGGNTSVTPPPDVGLSTSLTSVGLMIIRDTRTDHFYPTGGTVEEFTADFFANAFGSKYSFQSYRARLSAYWSLTGRQALAYNAHFCATGGKPPFYGECIYGTNNELRGYEAGRFFNRYMVTTQLEYRLVLPLRLGIVGFGGIGGVAPDAQAFFHNDAFLPAGGGGVRFMLSKAFHVNLRADLAVGKYGHTFSMGIGEAF